MVGLQCKPKQNFQIDLLVRNSDVNILLVARQPAADTPGIAITRRVEHAFSLYQAGEAPAVVMCGGVCRFERSEADARVSVGIVEGLPSEVIHTKDQSANTLENTIFTERKMAPKSWRYETLVTDNSYLLRAIFVFRALGIDFEGNPPLLASTTSTILPQFREYFARIGYMFRVRRYLKQYNENYLGSDYWMISCV